MEDLAHGGTTMIVVTHEMHFAQEAADRVVFMEDGQIIEQGPPEQVLNDPRHEETTHFLRRFLPLRSAISPADPRRLQAVHLGTGEAGGLVGRADVLRRLLQRGRLVRRLAALGIEQPPQTRPR